MLFFQNSIGSCGALEYTRPGKGGRITNKGSLSDKKIKFFFCQQLRNTAFPESMNTSLTAKLAIVISRSMKRNMRVGNIMTDLCGIAEDTALVFIFKSICQP